MIERKTLYDNQIYTWEEFKNKLDKPDLLLGNGFTMQFSGKFSYSSLFEIFLENCHEDFRPLFKSFGTTNFELILRYLNNAVSINRILGQEITLIQSAIEQLRNGLITSIEQIHPRNADIDFERLSKVAMQIEKFGNIYTTNYDLYLYHILMLSNDISRTKDGYIAYQDFFWGNQAPDGFKQFMDYQNYVYKDIYYLHGSLFIYDDGGGEVKLLKNTTTDELIESISREIRKNHFPIFVSEGDARDKLSSINRSRYLRFCLDSLAKNNSPIVIFGNALHEIDIHIIDAIKYNQRDIIYCLYIGDRSIESVLEEKHKFKGKFEYYRKHIEFIDSSTVFS
ncbi:MAG: DUF4917 family protein [Saprospiraceae bacterium]|nr:DUF4917 family protein [Saprospiraceae bacterium]